GRVYDATLAVDGCAVDTDPRGPWGRAVVRPGARSCGVGVAWTKGTYPAVVDPVWVTTGSMAAPRFDHTATLLGSGKVLVAGGDGNGGYLASAELYDASGGGTFAATGSMNSKRAFYTATLLSSGKVLVTGGSDPITGAMSSAELYDASGSGTFTPTGAMT